MTTLADQIGDYVYDLASKVVGELGALATENLRDRTPKRTGHAASNWMPSAGEPARGPFGGLGHPVYEQQSARIAAIRSYRLDDGNLFVNNDVRYVPFLDAKHPSGMGFITVALEDTVAQADAAIAARLGRGG